ncbi:MAG: ornithine carbamoyltransferase [Proteobacteria bacterium]|nr:ornithine carbamoyltransferase [Pseudomonadota bacterium]
MNLITLDTWTADEVYSLIALAHRLKKEPEAFSSAMDKKTLLMFFEKPSLRTRVSFEVGMTQMGGHAIYYNIGNSPLGKGETIEDFARVISRYCDLLMARLYSHEQMESLSRLATVPVINGLTDFSHPCQILADLMTIEEKKGRLKGLTLAYLGDGNNNVTHSLLYGCSLVGMNIKVGCPAGHATQPQPSVMKRARELCAASGAEVSGHNNAVTVVEGSDIVYTDSWMSYHIDPRERETRIWMLKPFQVTTDLMSHADDDAIFMNCLPAMRGEEQTAEVIDGPQSIVFDQAENRLHMQKALMLRQLGLA